MKALSLFLFLIILGTFSRSCTAQSLEPWRDPSLLKLVDGHLSGDHKDMLDPPDYTESAPINSDDVYDIDSLHELHRLFTSFTGTHSPNDYAIVTKALLALPLMGRSNGIQLLLRPPRDLYTGLLRKYAKHRLPNLPHIESPPGSIAVDTHVHTCYSHDSLADISTVLLCAYNRGLAGIAITDHDTIAGVHEANKALRRLIKAGKISPSFFIIPGEEVSLTRGHVIALFIKSEIPSGMTPAETIEAIHEQGGIAIAAHPLFDGGSLGELAMTLPFDAVETKSYGEMLRYSNKTPADKARRDAFYANCAKPQIGSSDSHDGWSIGACYTVLKCAPTLDAVKTAILEGKTTSVSDIPESNETAYSQPMAAKKSRVISVVSSVIGVDSYLCRLTHADDAGLTVWPTRSISFQWTVPF